MKQGRALPVIAAFCLFLVPFALPGASIAQTPPVAGCWEVVPASSVNGGEVDITRLVPSPAGEIWGISNGDPAGAAQTRSYIAHWDGEWKPLPALPLTVTYGLPAARVFSPTDVWALVALLNKGVPETTTAHWDGRSWQIVPIASPTVGYGLSDMDGTSSRDMWIAGTAYSGPHNGDQTGITFHYDGRTWNQEDTPTPDNQVSLNRVLALSQQDVWAIGSKALHWDGTQWQNIAGPSTGSDYRDLVGLSPKDIWAVGTNPISPVFGHWDGRGWTEMPAPNPGRNTVFQGIAAAAQDDIWAVGRYDDSALVTHWDGQAWTTIPNPVPGFSSTLTGIKAIGNEFWAVGSRGINTSASGSSVLIRYTSAPCPSAGPQRPLNPPVPLPGTGSRLFITGQIAGGVFLKYWQEHGGLQQQGYPISGVLGEQSDLNGHIYTVQYFERATFEYHPEYKGTPYEVLLAQLGTFQYKQKYPNDAPNQRANQDKGTLFFRETGKHLGGTFLKYWQDHGGLQQEGFPISEEFTEVSDLDGRPYTVQYFERAVFEWHPENAPPYDVLLSQLGHFRYESKYHTGQAQTNNPRQIASSIIPGTLYGGGDYLVWSDLRDAGYRAQTIYSYSTSQNRELPVSQSLVAPNGLPLATNGTLAFWTRRDADIRYLEGYSFRTGTEARLFQPATVSSPDFRRSDIALDQTTLFYSDNWTQHTGIFAQDLSTGNERQIYDKVPVPGSMVAADGALLWTEAQTAGANTTRTLRLYIAGTGAVTTLASGIGGLGGYGVSGDYAVYSFYGTITNQTTYLYNIPSGTRKVIGLGAASNPVIQGKRVAWVRWPSTASGEADGWKIETYDVDSGAVKTVASGLRAMPHSLVLAGNKLAFSADNDLSTIGDEVYILDLEPGP